MDGSDHLMTMDVMEMAVPVSCAEEGNWELYSQSAGSGSSSNHALDSSVSTESGDLGYYHLYLWYGKIREGSRIMEYHGYFNDDDLEDID